MIYVELPNGDEEVFLTWREVDKFCKEQNISIENAEEREL